MSSYRTFKIPIFYCRWLFIRFSIVTVTIVDTFYKHEQTSVSYEYIKADTAVAKILSAAIDSLPQGAGISARSGRANVILIRQNDTIFITAICDELLQKVYSYELQINGYKKIINQKDYEILTAEKELNKRSTTFKYYLIGFLAGVIITLFFTKKSVFEKILSFIKKIL